MVVAAASVKQRMSDGELAGCGQRSIVEQEEQVMSDNQMPSAALPLIMRAIRVGAFGGIEQLHLSSIPVPTPGRGEVLVRVRAAGVGPWDALVREGRSGLAQTLPVTPGADLSGIVVKVGDGVEDSAQTDPRSPPMRSKMRCRKLSQFAGATPSQP
jgi:Alcohol dehydrogenase GroES-like domain